jgi:hypothetical protein
MTEKNEVLARRAKIKTATGPNCVFKINSK